MLALAVAALLIGGAVLARRTITGSDEAKASDEITLNVLCADEIESFCQEVVDSFVATKPTVNGQRVTIELSAMDSESAADMIADREISPLVWIPASSAWTLRVNQARRAENLPDAYLTSGPYQILPVAESPTVFVGPRPRVALLQTQCGGRLTWPCIRSATITAGGWSALGGDPGWGLVKVGYANPLRTNTGLLALILMTYGYYDRPYGLNAGDITNTTYVDFVRDIGRSVTTFADSSAEWARGIVTRCPSFFDVALAYESVAATSIANARGRGCDLLVEYPAINVNSDFPFAIAMDDPPAPNGPNGPRGPSGPSDKVRLLALAVQRDAAVALRDHFYSPPSQKQALAHGLRPANPDVPIVGTKQNPLAENEANGIELVLPRAEIADFPSADVTTAMLATWKQKVQPS